MQFFGDAYSATAEGFEMVEELFFRQSALGVGKKDVFGFKLIRHEGT